MLHPGRVVVRGQKASRDKHSVLRADYVLFYKASIPLAVIEAKDNTHAVGAGMAQAINYAELLGVPFSFASNGDGFVFRDATLADGVLESNLALDQFPTPAELWERRFGEFNNQVRKVAAELDAILIEWNVAQFLADRRFLAPDRLHLNADGHQRVAHAVLEALGAPFDTNWKVPLPPAPKVKKSAELVADIRWFLDFAWPWIWRRIRGKSSGDGRTAKHQKPQNLPE